MPDVTHSVLVAGATGYMGRRLIPTLLHSGHEVRALVRAGSEHKLSSRCEVVIGDPLRRETYADQIAPADTWVHLVGVSHPSPSKAAEFRAIDLKSVEEAVPSAMKAGIRHFVYVSVAHPAPVMKAYIEVRRQCEQIIHDSGLRTTILRPWYVLGQGHRWPVALKPAYWLLEKFPATRDGALRLGLVTIDQMIQALAKAVEDPPESLRIVSVEEIRKAPS